MSEMSLGTIVAGIIIGSIVLVVCIITKPTWKELKEFLREKWEELKSGKI